MYVLDTVNTHNPIRNEPFHTKMPKSLLITTGAVVPFKKLIQTCLDPKLLHIVFEQGYNELIFQYGNTEGQQTFERALAAVPSDLASKLNITGFSFSNSIIDEINKVDLVIAHAGTGSILDALRCQKPLIVAVNSKLMGNHQQEIAEEFSKMGYLIMTDCSTR